MNLENEKKYLEKVEKVLNDFLSEYNCKIVSDGDNLISDRTYIWETFAEMDEMEQAAVQGEAHIRSDLLVELIKKRNLVEKQLESPFWGKIVFKENGATQSEDIYIGIGTISDKNERLLVVDWRAPVGDLYYNFELGKAHFKAPVGIIEGDIEGKVQHKIKNGIMLYAIDSTTTITDEVLIRELAKNASHIMKNIASTIQKEQNEIIRYPMGENILIQGVAGSGKTSIALHRVAFILYNARDTIRPKDILIISPNKAFSGYISNVLPELGEQNVAGISMESMALKELEQLCTIERRTTYLENLYNGSDKTESQIADMKYKASVEFVKDIRAFVKNIEKKSFFPRNFVFKDYTCSKETFTNLYFKRFERFAPLQRIPLIIEYVENDMIRHFRMRKNSMLRLRLTENLAPMFRRYSSLDIYRVLLEKLKEEGKNVLIPDINEEIPFSDVYGLLLLKVLYEGTSVDYGKFKHVVIDEMQDYIPTQYAVINKLFKCPKDILGDMNQIIDPYMNIGSLDTMRKLLGEHKFFELKTSYRSSAEIVEFTNNFTNQKIKSIERHEETPEIIQCEDLSDEASKILAEADRCLNKRGFGSIAVIARNNAQAEALFNQMKGSRLPITLLLDSSTKYQGGIVVTTAVIVKGFEFDEVIVADANKENYNNDSDKHILFVACTRALHVLKLFYTGEKFDFDN